LPRRPKASYHAARDSHSPSTVHVAVPHRMPLARVSASGRHGNHSEVYQVRSGDSLSSIAERTLGNSSRWREIYAANRAQISDPAFIRAGQMLRLPGHGARGGGTYRVKRGDSLYTIASTHLGHGHKWHAIWNLNRDKVPNARLIFPGQVLELPRS